MIVPAGARYALDVEDLRVSVLVAAALFSLVFIPHVLIHVRYSIVSRRSSIEFRADSNVIIFRSNGTTKLISEDDIQSVDMVLPRSLARNEIAAYPWQLYGYAILNLTSGEKLLVTSLLVPELAFPFEFRNLNTQEGLYCWPPNVPCLER